MIQCESRIGLYRWFDEEGKLLYIGISANVMGRLYQHMCTKNPWTKLIGSCQVKYYDSIKEARTAEKEAISTEHPPHNIMNNPTACKIQFTKERRRGHSAKYLEAEKYFKKNPTLSCVELSKRFGLNPTTITRSEWWKSRSQLKEQK